MSNNKSSMSPEEALKYCEDIESLCGNLVTTIKEIKSELEAHNGGVGAYKIPELGILLASDYMATLDDLIRSKVYLLREFVLSRFGSKGG